MNRSSYLTLIAFSGIAALAYGCVAGETSASGSGLSSDNGSQGQGASETNDGGAGGSGGLSLGNGGSGASEEEVCNGTEAVAEQRTLDLLVVLDRSGSMGSGPGSQWDGATNALRNYFLNANSAGVYAGLNFFPPDQPGVDECANGTYNPPHVQLGELGTGYEQVLIGAMDATSASGGTPTHGAIYGTLQYATAFQDLNPDHQVAIVLASDGQPTSCDTSIANISNLAQSAYNYNGVLTFTVAISGADVQALNTIAQKGGTGQAFDVTNDINQFAQKMQEISAAALGCEFPIPQPENGEFDPLKLNVIYNGQKLTQRQNPQACGPDGGWYYDDNDAPTTAYLCPASCTQVSGDLTAEINFEFGCPTKFE